MMRLTIIVIGTQGDIQPLVALGQGLQAAGHSVRVATHSRFEELVRSRGLDFSAVADDPQALLESDSGRASLSKSDSVRAASYEIIRQSAPMMHRSLANCWQACRDTDTIIVSPIGMLLGYQVAEKLRVPLIRAYIMPTTPSRCYPHDFAPSVLRFGSRFSSYNLLTHLLPRQLLWQAARSSINAARQEVLDLPPLPLMEPFRALDRQRCLLLYGFSPHVFPPAPDWGNWIHVTGYWFLDRPPDWQPPTEVADFLQAGPPPVYVGFGSMSSLSPEETSELVVTALTRAGQRGMLLSGWGGMSNIGLPDNMLMVESVPHDWLFPRMAAVVHHGGAGTTAAGLRAGIPSVIIPFLPDQRLWAQRLHAFGVGPRRIPRRQLSVERLAGAIRQATTDAAMRQRAPHSLSPNRVTYACSPYLTR